MAGKDSRQLSSRTLQHAYQKVFRPDLVRVQFAGLLLGQHHRDSGVVVGLTERRNQLTIFRASSHPEIDDLFCFVGAPAVRDCWPPPSGEPQEILSVDQHAIFYELRAPAHYA